MFKKMSVVLFGIAASSITYAGTMGPVCTPGNVTVPCKTQLWDFGVQGLYLRTVYDADRAYQLALFDRVQEVNTSWDWGYRLEGSYHFNTGNDVSLNWTHYSSEATQRDLQEVAVFSIIGIDAFEFSMVDQSKFDQVNLEIGQHVDMGARYAMRFYGGLQYAAIEVNDTSYYPPPVEEITQFNNTDFKGFGPLIGTNYAYYFNPAFSLVMNAAGSILYGTSRYNEGFVATPPGLVFFSEHANKTAMVPSLEGKIGLNYAYPMIQGAWNIEGGYKAINYFNALQGQLFNAPFSGIRNSDYSLYGPYIGIKYIGFA